MQNHSTTHPVTPPVERDETFYQSAHQLVVRRHLEEQAEQAMKRALDQSNAQPQAPTPCVTYRDQDPDWQRRFRG